MELVLIGIGALLATTAYFLPSTRMVLAPLAMIAQGLGTGAMLAEHPTIITFISVVFGIAQIFNYARLVIQRLHAKHLKMALFVGGGRILLIQVALYALAIVAEANSSVNGYLFDFVIISQLISAFVVLYLTIRRLYVSKPEAVTTHYSDKELPSISILIPARNEDDYLIELLKSVVANDYPKLEILVLDDCSTGKRIPEIVKEFAQDGVRFIQGDVPREDWLAKNQAYDTLASSSSGDWLIFMGVDVRLGVGSIRALMHYAITHDRKMLSVMPRRFGGAFWAGFFTPLRYFKEMLKLGVWKFNAPALSTLWLIKRDEYTRLGGMPSVARKVIPEHYFANRLNARNSYSFVHTNDYLQIATAKSLKEQLATSIRTLYPGLHHRIEWTFGVAVLMAVVLLVPFIGFVMALIDGNTSNAVLYGIMVADLSIAHLLVTTYTNPILWPLAIVNFPYLVVQEITLYIISMYGYEFGQVVWKDRNICLPVLQAIPTLPPAPTKD